MKKLIEFLFAITLFLIPILANAQGFTRGEPINSLLLLCESKDDALLIANTDAKEGAMAAQAIFTEKNCAYAPVMGFAVGRVIHSVQIEREGRKHTLRVVEIIEDDNPVAYFFTVLPVDQREKRGGNT